jgi:hypothetical protein
MKQMDHKSGGGSYEDEERIGVSGCPVSQSRRQAAGLLVRRTMCTSPHNPARGGQALDLLALTKDCSFLIWKPCECPVFIYGWTLL